MSREKILALKARLAQASETLTREELEWLLNRVEELEKENEFLKKELRYLEYQGEIDLS